MVSTMQTKFQHSNQSITKLKYLKRTQKYTVIMIDKKRFLLYDVSIYNTNDLFRTETECGKPNKERSLVNKIMVLWSYTLSI